MNASTNFATVTFFTVFKMCRHRVNADLVTLWRQHNRERPAGAGSKLALLASGMYLFHSTWKHRVQKAKQYNILFLLPLLLLEFCVPNMRRFKNQLHVFHFFVEFRKFPFRVCHLSPQIFSLFSFFSQLQTTTKKSLATKLSTNVKWRVYSKQCWVKKVFCLLEA